MAVAAATIDRLREAVGGLPYGLAEHVFRVEDEALKLAGLYRLDEGRVRAAVLGHDLLRADTPERLLEMAAHQGFPVTALDRAEPMLLHGPLAARILAEDYGVTDPEVLSAVAIHTTARGGMSSLEKILFIADKIEAHKVARRPELAEVYELAATDLDAAVLQFLDLYLVDGVKRGWLLHAGTIDARNDLVAARQGATRHP